MHRFGRRDVQHLPFARNFLGIAFQLARHFVVPCHAEQHDLPVRPSAARFGGLDVQPLSPPLDGVNRPVQPPRHFAGDFPPEFCWRF